MKIDRAEVEEMLAACERDRIGPHPGNETLAALCRMALEVLDAPEATVEWQRDVGMVLGSCRLSSDLVGQRVRLVRVGEG